MECLKTPEQQIAKSKQILLVVNDISTNHHVIIINQSEKSMYFMLTLSFGLDFPSPWPFVGLVNSVFCNQDTDQNKAKIVSCGL